MEPLYNLGVDRCRRTLVFCIPYVALAKNIGGGSQGEYGEDMVDDMIYEIMLYQLQSCCVATNQENCSTKHLAKDICPGSTVRHGMPRDGLTVKAEVIEDDVVFFVVLLKDLGSGFGRRIGKVGY